MSSGEAPSVVGGAAAARAGSSRRADELRQQARERVLRAETLRSEADALQDAAEVLCDAADVADRDARLEEARKIQSAMEVLRDLVGNLGARMEGVLFSLDVLQESSGPNYRRRLGEMTKADLVARILQLSSLLCYYGSAKGSVATDDVW